MKAVHQPSGAASECFVKTNGFDAAKPICWVGRADPTVVRTVPAVLVSSAGQRRSATIPSDRDRTPGLCGPLSASNRAPITLVQVEAGRGARHVGPDAIPRRTKPPTPRAGYRTDDLDNSVTTRSLPRVVTRTRAAMLVISRAWERYSHNGLVASAH